jgi:glycosyltransferase involved in cell wall biosynthesis
MTTQQNIQISVALVTRNRPESLARSLSSWRQQSVQPFEIVVSDDSDDPFQAQNQHIAQQFEARWMAGPRQGLYANRNHIVKACRGSHIRSADDDHELPQNHCALSLEAVTADPSSIWIIGEFYPPFDNNVASPPPCPGQLHPRGFSEPPADPQNSWALSDGASIYPRAVFDSGLRFAERFKFGAAYMEFGSLLHAQGFRIRHLESTFVFHHYNAEARSFMSQEIDLESRFFAILCHSFIYQPTVKNQFLTTLECIRQIGCNGPRGVRCFRGASNAFRLRRKEFMRRSSQQ